MANKALAVNPSTGAIVAPVSATTFRNANGLQIGVDIQAWSTDLDKFVTYASWSGIVPNETLTIAANVSLSTKNLTTDGNIAGNVVSGDEVTAGSVLTLGGVAVPTISSTSTLTNKTINLSSNTLVATSAQLAAAVTDETGSGALVFATNPTLSSPVLGVATGTSFNGLAITATSGSTLTLSNGVILSVSNTLTFTGTNGTSFAFPGSSGTVYVTGNTDVSVADGGTGASTAAGARTNLGFGTICKTSDTAKTSDTSPAADPALQFSVAANTNYRFKVFAIVTVAADGPQVKGGFSGPASPTSIYFTSRVWSTGIVSAWAGAYSGYSTSHGASSGLTSNTVNYVWELEGTLRNGANAGTFSFDWSQWNSSGSATTVKAGSYIQWEVCS